VLGAAHQELTTVNSCRYETKPAAKKGCEAVQRAAHGATAHDGIVQRAKTRPKSVARARPLAAGDERALSRDEWKPEAVCGEPESQPRLDFLAPQRSTTITSDLVRIRGLGPVCMRC
jgi:hypothetical protein